MGGIVFPSMKGELYTDVRQSKYGDWKTAKIRAALRDDTEEKKGHGSKGAAVRMLKYTNDFVHGTLD